MESICNIAISLRTMADQRPDAVAIWEPAGRDAQGKRRFVSATYRDLDQRSDRIARGLHRYGIGRGDRAVLMVRPSIAFFALTFGLFKAGVVPVLIDPGLGRRQLKQCLQEAAPSAFIGIPLAHVARLLLGWGRASVTRLVTVGRKMGWGGATLDEIEGLGGDGPPLLEPTQPDEVAAILFTSGSTGTAKGVVYAHRHFLAQVELIRQMYDIQPGEVDLPTFPTFALFDPALGMTTVVPEMDFTRPASVDPQMLAELIEQFGVTNIFGSPAVLATVVRHATKVPAQWRTVRRVLSAGAPVPAAVLQGMGAILPDGVQVWTPYGATECLPVASIGSDEVLSDTRHGTERGLGVCVGQVVAPNDVRIVGITDGPIASWSEVREIPHFTGKISDLIDLCASGVVGEICVRGPTTTAAYFGRDAATALAKIPSSHGVFHRMGDVGWIDGRGRLWYCGRKGHRVELHDRTLHTAPVEEVFNTHPAVRRSALVSVVRQGVRRPVVLVEREPTVTTPEEQLFESLRALGDLQPATRGITEFAVHPAFPVDIRHNAKIGRELLAQWADARWP